MSDEATTKQLLDMMENQQKQIQQQMDQQQVQLDRMTTLEAENRTLREEHASHMTLPITGVTSSSKTKRPDRPIVEPNINDSEWEVWQDAWKRYKKMTSISGDAVVMELRSCCAPDVNKLLFQYVGAASLETATEEVMLAHIKSIAVKGLHIEVHRKNFGGLYQEDGESITHYVARLRSQAALCNFSLKCGCDDTNTVSYAEQMVEHQLIVGLKCQDHQAKVLSEASSLKTLAEKIKRLQTLETTEDSTSQLKPPGISKATAAKWSQHKMKKKEGNRDTKASMTKKCRGCGRSSQTGKTMNREDCPAWNKVCRNCNVKGHFKEVCERSRSGQATGCDNDNSESDSEASASFAFVTTNETTSTDEVDEPTSHPDFRHCPKQKVNR